MSVFQEIIEKMREENKYKEMIKPLKNDIERYSNLINKANEKVQKLRQIKETGTYDKDYFKHWDQNYIRNLFCSPVDLDMAISNAENECTRWTETLKSTRKEIRLMRPNTKKDVAEREFAAVHFSGEVAKKDINDLFKLRFHSTTLSATEDILKSGGIISSVDRLNGYHSTTNDSNEISVSNIKEIQYSMNFWTDISAYNRCMPSGCMFVLQPKTMAEVDMTRSRQMENVYFHENPQQLIGIATTSENIPTVIKSFTFNLSLIIIYLLVFIIN